MAPKTARGSILLDSLLALAMLGAMLGSWAMFNQMDFNRQLAKKLAAETEAYARIYAKYMNNHYDTLVKNIKSGDVITLSPDMLGNDWATDLDKSNLFKQTPCVTIVPNPHQTGDLEAVMYYVGGNSSGTHKYAMLEQQALMIIGSKGGLLLNGAIIGNSGWSVGSGSEFLADAKQCANGGLANDSLAVNIDLLDDWNQNTQPSTAITKDMDGGGSADGIRKMPGHLLNSNTSKSDISISADKGVILDNSDPNNPVKLKMEYGDGSNSVTLSLMSNNKNMNVTTVADTFEPMQTGKAGDACMPQELGKLIIDAGNDTTAQYLNRSNLICSQNNMLCAGANASSTCYLPTVANNIVFANASMGVQNSNGQFICPRDTPFAKNVITSSGVATNSKPILGTLSGYAVTIGYERTAANIMITQVTCSSMPDYEIYAQPH